MEFRQPSESYQDSLDAVGLARPCERFHRLVLLLATVSIAVATPRTTCRMTTPCCATILLLLLLVLTTASSSRRRSSSSSSSSSSSGSSSSRSSTSSSSSSSKSSSSTASPPGATPRPLIFWTCCGRKCCVFQHFFSVVIESGNCSWFRVYFFVAFRTLFINLAPKNADIYSTCLSEFLDFLLFFEVWIFVPKT